MTCGLRPSIARADFKRRARVCPGSKCDIPVGCRRTCNQTLRCGVRAAIRSRSHNNASFIGEGRRDGDPWGDGVSWSQPTGTIRDPDDAPVRKCSHRRIWMLSQRSLLLQKQPDLVERWRRTRHLSIAFAAPEPPSCARVATSARQRPTLGRTGEM